MKDYNYSNIRCEFYRIFGYSANRGVARVWSCLNNLKENSGIILTLAKLG